MRRSTRNMRQPARQPTPTEEQAFYFERIGIEAMTPEGGDMPLADFQEHFDRDRLFPQPRCPSASKASSVRNRCADAYFRDYAVSFWSYFCRLCQTKQRKAGSSTFAMPIETYVRQAAAGSGSGAIAAGHRWRAAQMLLRGLRGVDRSLAPWSHGICRPGSGGAGFLISTSTPAGTAPCQGPRLHAGRPAAGLGLRRQDHPHLGLARAGSRCAPCAAIIGQGNDGKIFAVAVSPDGKTIAAGGYFGAGLGDKPPYGDVGCSMFSTGKIKAVLKAAGLCDLRHRLLTGRQLLAAGGADGFVYLWRLDDESTTGWTLDDKLDADSWHIEQARLRRRRERALPPSPRTTASGSGIWRQAEEIALSSEAEPLRETASWRWPCRWTASCSPPAATMGWSSLAGDRRHACPRHAEAGFPDRLADLRFGNASGRVLRLSLRRQASHARLDCRRPASRCCSTAGMTAPSLPARPTPDGSLVATAGGSRNAIQRLGPADR